MALLIASSLAVQFGCGGSETASTDEGPGPFATEQYALTSNGGIVSVAASSAQAGYPAASAADASYATRWSTYGHGQWIAADLGTVQSVQGLQVAWYRGSYRQYYFTIGVSTDGARYTNVYSGTSSGTTLRLEQYAIPATSARFVKLTVNGNSKNSWDSVTEVAVTLAPGSTPPPLPLAVAVTPQATTLAAGASAQFSAGITGTTNTTVSWTVQEGAAGGSLTSTGWYTAPASAGTYHVVATSQADGGKSSSSTVTVSTASPSPSPTPTPSPAVTVAVTPASVTLPTGGATQFSDTVSGTTNTSVTWTVQEGAGGGAVTSTGRYTAPAAPGTYHVVAASQADSSKTSTSTITVNGPVTTPPGVVLAFPGCQGSGCATVGGRGGAVYRITNLNDSGAGSLRACVEASGPRTCVFAVAGHIALRSTLSIYNPYITIAGQTAPGGGIELSGQDLSGNTTLNTDLVQVGTHDVVIRYVKMRLGPVSSPSYADTLVVQSGAQYNVVIDHCTLMWGLWDNLSVYATGSGYNRNQTYSWNILAEPLLQPGATGSVAVNVSGANSTIADASTNIDMHHNLVASSDHRNPTLRTASGHLVNNVVYNYNYYAMKAKGSWDLIGNYFKPGPMNRSPPNEIETWTSTDGNSTSFTPSLFLSGNSGPHNSYSPSSDGDQAADWKLTAFSTSGDGGESSSPLSASYARSSPLATAAAGAEIVADAANSLADPSGPFLTTVGASQGLTCSGGWVSNRDSVDARIVNEFATGSGTSNKALSTISGYPALTAGSPCADSDGDGIPDAYEIPHGLNPNFASDGKALQADGYTNLEHYLAGQ